jgi:hypothetical protein
LTAASPLEKQPTDQLEYAQLFLEYAQLFKDNVPAAPIYSGLDGGMNKAFLAQFPGRVTLSAASFGSVLVRKCVAPAASGSVGSCRSAVSSWLR